MREKHIAHEIIETYNPEIMKKYGIWLDAGTSIYVAVRKAINEFEPYIRQRINIKVHNSLRDFWRRIYSIEIDFSSLSPEHKPLHVHVYNSLSNQKLTTRDARISILKKFSRLKEWYADHKLYFLARKMLPSFKAELIRKAKSEFRSLFITFVNSIEELIIDIFFYLHRRIERAIEKAIQKAKEEACGERPRLYGIYLIFDALLLRIMEYLVKQLKDKNLVDELLNKIRSLWHRLGYRDAFQFFIELTNKGIDICLKNQNLI